jgi:hypothetical protein
MFDGKAILWLASKTDYDLDIKVHFDLNQEECLIDDMKSRSQLNGIQDINEVPMHENAWMIPEA